jgi:hypothetical protein
MRRSPGVALVFMKLLHTCASIKHTFGPSPTLAIENFRIKRHPVVASMLRRSGQKRSRAYFVRSYNVPKEKSKAD